MRLEEDKTQPPYNYGNPRGALLLIPRVTVDTREDLGRVVV